MGVGVEEAEFGKAIPHPVFGHEVGDAAAETADGRMILEGHHPVLGLRAGLGHTIVGEGFERCDMKMLDRYAPRLEGGGGTHGLLGADARGDDGDVRTFGYDACTIELQRLCGRKEPRDFLSEHPHVYRTVYDVGHVEHALDVGGIANLEYRHVGHTAEHGDVVDRLMADTAGCGDTRKEAEHPYPEIRIGNGHFDLIERAAIKKHGEGMHEGRKALTGHAAGPAHHVLLGHAQVEEAVGIGIAEGTDLGGAGKVAREDNHLGLVGGPGDQVSFVDLLHEFHRLHLLEKALELCLLFRRLEPDEVDVGLSLFEKRHAAGAVGVSQHKERDAPVLDAGGRLEGLHIVPVDRLDSRTEAPQPVGEGVDVHDVLRGPVYLLTVYIDKHQHRIEPVMNERLDRLIGLPLFELTVGHEHDSAATLALHPSGEGDTTGLTERLPK